MKRTSSPLSKEQATLLGESPSPPSLDVKSRIEGAQRKSYLVQKGIAQGDDLQLDSIFSEAMEGRDDKRHLPNDLARSSLFTTRNKTAPRRLMTQEKLFHYNEHISVYFTGSELRAEDDELIWLQILNYGKSVPLGQPFEFSIKDLVKEVDWTKNGRNYDRARKCLSRLKATEILVTNTKAYGHSGAMSLIQNYMSANDEEGQPTHFKMWIDPSLIVLFAGNTFTSHSWEIYRTLSPVARRLADHIISHKAPYPLDLVRFQGMCGSADTNIRSWKQTVKKACAEIVASMVASKACVEKGNLIVCLRNELQNLKPKI
jgi:hypothetical protein